MLYTAVDLFFTYGFHAVGIDRIIAEVGVTKTTYYNHFESKDDLIMEALRKKDEWESASFLREVQERAGFDPGAMLIAFFDVIDEHFNRPEFRGCLFINACAEFPSPHDPVHQTAAAHYTKTRDTIAQVARAAGADDPKALAGEWIILLEGAMTSRLATGDNNAAKVSRSIAERVLEERLPKS